MSPTRSSDGNGPQTGSQGLWRELAGVMALFAAGGAFIFMFTSLMLTL
jgi:hypothetical protein